jgi:hypothetical protein
LTETQDFIEEQAQLKIPAITIGELARALNASPGLSFKEAEVPVVINDTEYLLKVDGYLSYEMTQLHPALWAQQPIVLTLYPKEGPYTIDLNEEETAMLYYTLEKVIAGADPVDLDGQVTVRKFLKGDCS